MFTNLNSPFSFPSPLPFPFSLLSLFLPLSSPLSFLSPLPFPSTSLSLFLFSLPSLFLPLPPLLPRHVSLTHPWILIFTPPSCYHHFQHYPHLSYCCFVFIITINIPIFILLSLLLFLSSSPIFNILPIIIICQHCCYYHYVILLSLHLAVIVEKYSAPLFIIIIVDIICFGITAITTVIILESVLMPKALVLLFLLYISLVSFLFQSWR